MLNNRQKIVIYVAVILIILSFLFPTWNYGNKYAGFNPVFAPPPLIPIHLEDGVWCAAEVPKINYYLMEIQVAVILIITGLLLLALKSPKDPN